MCVSVFSLHRTLVEPGTYRTFGWYSAGNAKKAARKNLRTQKGSLFCVFKTGIGVWGRSICQLSRLPGQFRFCFFYTAHAPLRVSQNDSSGQAVFLDQLLRKARYIRSHLVGGAENAGRSALKVVGPTSEKCAVALPVRKPNAAYRSREHLTEREVERLIEAAKDNRWGHRDATRCCWPSGTVSELRSWSTFAGSKRTWKTPSCMSGESSRVLRPHIP